MLVQIERYLGPSTSSDISIPLLHRNKELTKSFCRSAARTGTLDPTLDGRLLDSSFPPKEEGGGGESDGTGTRLPLEPWLEEMELDGMEGGPGG